ncbi:histidinol-phosphate transaminase [Sphingomonas flavalba]|uniref:histidinol-phosphate transaminase n=1 Tax=Sphingomonas flavalba TaxID=2559804 RepID=UPI00109DA29F|nr:histidinol-phosphate transaminase [Sphingomonas flavalba]
MRSRTSPAPRAALAACPPYVQGKSAIAGMEKPIKLSSNESPFGPSPAAKAAYLAAVDELHRYPDGSQRALREALAARFDVEADQLIAGNGSEELILLALRAFVDPGDQVVLSQNGFVMTRIHALAQGAEVVEVEEADWRVSVDNILAAVTERTRVVAIANPNNPTGTYISAAELRRLHAGLPENVLLMIDSAYGDYVVAPDYDSGIAIVRTASNAIMTRTFSKLYGLAGMRIGWAYGSPDVIAAIQRIRTPFNANAPALAAATAALGDRDYADRVRDHTIAWRGRMAAALADLGIPVVPSVTNFLLLTLSPDSGLTSKGVAAHLLEHGIIPRPLGVSGPGNSLRITIGTEEENLAFLAAMESCVRVPSPVQ